MTTVMEAFGWFNAFKILSEMPNFWGTPGMTNHESTKLAPASEALFLLEHYYASKYAEYVSVKQNR